jgi:hypothetical protein
MSAATWIEANRRLLALEFARIRSRLSTGDSREAEAAVAIARDAMPAPATIDVLTDSFGLTVFERDILLLCAGVEMDVGVATQCAAPGATFGLALATLADAHWSAITPVGPLRRERLLEPLNGRALTTARLALDERVLHFLAGVNYVDPRLAASFLEHTHAGAMAPSHELAVLAAIETLDRADRNSVVQLIGDDVAASRDVAHVVAGRHGLGLRVLRASELPTRPDDVAQMATLWNREALLLDLALLVDSEGADARQVCAFVRRLAGLVLIATDNGIAGVASRVHVPAIDAEERRQLWRDGLGKSAQLLNGSLESVAAHFRMRPADIADTAKSLRASGHEPELLRHALWKACREKTRQHLDDLAQRIEPVATWDDLILPDAQLATLREIAAQVRSRLVVEQRWGFASKCGRGLGIGVLFSGESGTGKTMAAEVLANELELDVYRIDLSAMVSKYIGETEKNLRRVFDAAEQTGAILLFDEADALFGKRSEVKDSHDRYANIEVSYLLQRMEAYRGLAILTTNLKGALDIAFHRRLRFVVQFPFPDSRLRERIWRGVFPPAAPLAPLDHSKLAQLNVAGGSIRNIALNAAFLAADSGSSIGMSHLLRAARGESVKRERPFSDAEVRGWV